MIFDNIKNAHSYYSLDNNIKVGLDFILNNSLLSFENGNYEIIPNEVRANIQEYYTKPLSECVFEAHRKYIDIQYMIRGSEKMGVREISDLVTKIEYDEKKDVEFFKGSGNLIEVPQGYFTIFYPQDGHMPCIENITSELIKKVVVKILI